MKTVDPDRGTTTSAYDSLDRVSSTTDGANRTITTTYDELDRKTGSWKGAATTGTKIAEWTYDTPALGQLASSTRFTNGLPYTRQVVSYDGLYRPTKTRLVLPATDPLVAEGTTATKVPATLDVGAAYNRDGTLQSTTEPAVAGLPSEVLSRTYTDLGLPQKASGTSGVVLDTAYNQFGDPIKTTLGVSDANTNRVWLTSSYDGLRREATFQTTETNGTNHLLDLAYTYDAAGQITKIADIGAFDGGPDYQCFRYDGYQRLTTAWTPAANNCTTNPTTSGLDTTGAPYWHDFTYKPSGLRNTWVINATTTGGVTKTVTSTYGGLCGTQALGPHVLNKTVATFSNGATADTDVYCANAAGETTQAASPSDTALAFDWNEEGRLLNIKRTGAATMTNIYDADGNLLIRRPAAGAAGVSTLYLGATEVQVTKTITSGVASYAAKGLRYYDHMGDRVAVRTGAPGTTSKLTFLAGDHHGTASAQWDALAPATTRSKRHTDPFGNIRGADPTSPAWIDDKRFLGMPHDQTNGLTHIGARDYMPETGRFLSVDPILDPADPQSLTGYTYSNNNPINMHDPTGLRPPEADEGLLKWDGDSWVPTDKAKSGGSSGGGTTSSGGTSSQEDVILNQVATHDFYAQGRDMTNELIMEFMQDEVGLSSVQLFNVRNAFACMNELPSCVPRNDVIKVAEGLADGSLEGTWLAAKAGAGYAVGGAVGKLGGAVVSKVAGLGFGLRAASTVKTAAPSTFVRTEALAGRASSRNVRALAESMRKGGWQGAGIDVVEIGGQRIIVDGHHRVAAARLAGIDVPYQVVDPATVIGRGQWSSIDDILQDTYTVGRDRLR